MNPTFVKLIRIIVGIVATIVLGAIGSGLWERFLGPALDGLTRVSIGVFSHGHNSYRDSIYESAAKGFHEAHALALYTLFLSLLPVGYMLILRRHPTRRTPQGSPPSSLREFVRSRTGYWVVLILTAVVFVTVMFTTLRLRHINETITYSLAAFEIVRPYVGDQKYTIYRSRYFSMRTAAEFEALHREVLDVAKKHEVRLPEYQPL